MPDETIAPYDENALNSAIGRGTIYRVLGIVVAAALVVTLIVGMTSSGSIGLLSTNQAFMMGGLAMIVLCTAVLVLLFSLTGTIRHINRELEDLTRLRQSIEVSYDRLATSAENLGHELGELRHSLPALRKLTTALQKINKKTPPAETV